MVSIYLHICKFASMEIHGKTLEGMAMKVNAFSIRLTSVRVIVAGLFFPNSFPFSYEFIKFIIERYYYYINKNI